MKSIIHKNNPSICGDFLLSVYILTENQKYKFHHISLSDRYNILLYKLQKVQVYNNLDFHIFYNPEAEVGYINNERIVKTELFGKCNSNLNLQLSYSLAGKEATYIIVNDVVDYYESKAYSDNMAKIIFGIDYCNHEYIPLFTNYICKHCGKEQ